MIFHDLTPTYLAPSPADRLLHTVRRKVTELWLSDKRLADPTSSSWEELLLAARYFRLRREVLEASPANIVGFTRDIRITFLSHLITACVGMALLVLLGLDFSRIPFSELSVRDKFLDGLLFANTAVLWTLVMSIWWSHIAPDRSFSPAMELAEIASFDHLVPNAVSMAGHEEATPSAVDEIEAVAHSPLGAPIIPPGLTELTLSRENGSLRSIRDQLKTTRLVDSGMTIVSFLAFIAGILFCFWQLAETERIAQGMIGVGGSGLIGLFCFYSTGRARSSQIALGLFESLVAELTAALDAASQASGELRNQMERAAWRQFRIELNELYLLERNQKPRAKLPRPSTPRKS
jgi:hypothetical protein